MVRTFVLAMLASTTAIAQSTPESFTLPLDRFRPTIDDKGLGTTEAGDISPHLGYQTGLILNYALNPLVLRNAQGNVVDSIIAHRLAGDAMFEIGLYDYVEVGVDLPVELLNLPGQVTDQTLNAALGLNQGVAGIGIGDLKLVPKIRILREDKHFVSLALIPALTLPTAGGIKSTSSGLAYDYGGSYLGEGPGRVAFIPEVALSKNISGFRVAGNLAYRLRQPVKYLGVLDVNPEFVYRAGVGWDVSSIAPKMNSLMLFAEIFGATADRNPFGLIRDPNADATQQKLEEIDARLTNPLEWAAGARYRLFPGVSVEGGFGAGILPGYGSPDLRLFAGVRYAQETRDRDGDGVNDDVDKCPDDPGPAYNNGCPDPDSDGDGIPNSKDKCPEVPGEAKFQGCPNPDTDGDGILDKDDKCPTEPGLPEYQGCPPPDRDKDGIPDDKDACPDEAGPAATQGCPDKDGDGIADKDDLCPDEAGPAATKGCPDKDGDGIPDKDDKCPDVKGVPQFQGCADRDGDGIPDPDDKCPDEPGTKENNGCPTKAPPLIIVTKEKIELHKSVYFDIDKDTIKKESFPLLDAVVTVLKSHSEIKKLMVEGHTDNQGGAAHNLDLSKRRAASVMKYLTDHGVEESRLTSEGYGDTVPIADNKTAKGREQNRRVEMKILEQE